MNRYDDPHWYEQEEPATNASPPAVPAQAAQSDADLSAAKTPAESNTVVHEQHRSKKIAQALAVLALVVLAFFGGWFSHEFFSGTFAFNQSSQSRAYEQLFEQAWVTVDQNYVDRQSVNYKNMSYAAINAMVQTLHDTGHTRFLTASQIQNENQQLSGKFTGIGIYLRQDPTTKALIITSTIPGSPAAKSGLKYNDIILAVNGASTSGKDIAGLSSMIQGQAGTSVTLTIKRPSTNQTLTFHILRAQITVPNVVMHYISRDHIADIQIVQFSYGVTTQLKAALTKAKTLGAKKIILDLRDNPGGYLSEAINTASDFMKSGNVLLEQNSNGQRTPVPVTGNTLDTSNTMVVLVNSNTASAAEIVSGALKDNHRAVIIGQTTFGTGTVLQQFNLANGSALLIGTQEWLTPDGQFIRGHGITPNIQVALGKNAAPLFPSDANSGNLTEPQILSSGDTQLAAAINYLKTH